MNLHLDVIESAISAHKAQSYVSQPEGRRAAVAVIFRQHKDTLGVLFILRATKRDDPWSGQMAFPGGHVDVEDESSRHTAERETWEETSLDLKKQARYLGKLDDARAHPKIRGREARTSVGRVGEMIVTPHLFALHQQRINLNFNHEVADVLWGSLSDMYHHRNLTTLDSTIADRRETFPGYQVGGQIVWGLTYRILGDFFKILNPAFECP